MVIHVPIGFIRLCRHHNHKKKWLRGYAKQSPTHTEVAQANPIYVSLLDSVHSDHNNPNATKLVVRGAVNMYTQQKAGKLFNNRNETAINIATRRHYLACATDHVTHSDT